MVEEARFREDNCLVNVKLAFSIGLTVLGGATGLYALRTPFAEGKLLTGLGALLYMILLGAYTGWLAFLQVPTCFRGQSQAGRKKIWLQSRLEPVDGTYWLTALDPKTGQPVPKCTQGWCVGEWIHEGGAISGSALCAALATFVYSEAFKSLLRSE